MEESNNKYRKHCVFRFDPTFSTLGSRLSGQKQQPDNPKPLNNLNWNTFLRPPTNHGQLQSEMASSAPLILLKVIHSKLRCHARSFGYLHHQFWVVMFHSLSVWPPCSRLLSSLVDCVSSYFSLRLLPCNVLLFYLTRTSALLEGLWVYWPFYCSATAPV